MRRRTGRLTLAFLAVVAVEVLAIGGLQMGISSAARPERGPAGASSSPVAQASSIAEALLKEPFVRVAKQVGPAVVSISTEQIEQVQRYFRGHPFMGDDPFEQFFQEFFGEAPNQEFKRFGLGSGVLIDKRGFILTNEHVVGDADKITVTLSDGREFDGEVKGKDIRSDLAVIKIASDELPVATLGDSDMLQTGQWAIALGNLFGLSGSSSPEPTLTVGVISATHRHLPRLGRTDRDYSSLIQTDAAINPGNSGGPLLNLDGEVIGVNVAIISSGRGFEGVGFAVAFNKA